MLRIIAGKYRGIKLFEASSTKTRATKDRVREAIFSMIQFRLPNANFLDLFSGTGAIGIEACSRGAKTITLVESDSQASHVILKNLEKLNIPPNVLKKLDVLYFLKTHSEHIYDLIFLDPPYQELELLNTTLRLLASQQILHPSGLIIVETLRACKLELSSNFVVLKRRDYGKTSIFLIQNKL